jgi:hypothetical protein
MDIYDADGLLDRQRIQDRLDEILGGVLRAHPKARAALTVLLDEVAEGFGSNPLDAPDMTREYINMCRPVWSSAPPLRVGENEQ